MKLTELEAEFLRFERRADGRVFHHTVAAIGEAHGVMFNCPKCAGAMSGHSHSIICWSRSRGTPELATPGPGRWRMDGTGLADLTLNAEQPGGARSVKVIGGCGFHGFVTAGDAV